MLEVNEETIGPLSFHSRSFTEGFLNSKGIEWNHWKNSTFQPSPAGESVEKITLRNAGYCNTGNKKIKCWFRKKCKKDDSSLMKGGSGVTLQRAWGLGVNRTELYTWSPPPCRGRFMVYITTSLRFEFQSLKTNAHFFKLFFCISDKLWYTLPFGNGLRTDFSDLSASVRKLPQESLFCYRSELEKVKNIAKL